MLFHRKSTVTESYHMPRINLVSPPGRIVSGSVSRPNLTDMYGALRDRPQYFIALAVPKNNPQIPQLFQTIYQHALSEFSRHHDVLRRINLGLQKNTGFAWKIEDGDLPSVKTGKLREGWQGCWVFKLSTTIAPQAVDTRNNLIDPTVIETGYYADVAFSVAGNDHADHTAGLYMNPNFVRFLGYGERIAAGPTPEQAFGSVGQSMGSPTPLSPAGMPGTGYGGGATPLATVIQTALAATPPQGPSPFSPIPGHPDGARGLMPILNAVAGGSNTNPLALPANAPAALADETVAPVPMPGMTPPASDFVTVSHFKPDAPAPSIPGFSSGAAQ